MSKSKITGQQTVMNARETYRAMSPELRAELRAASHSSGMTIAQLPTKVTDERERQERIVHANHVADVENGLSEAEACESDAFERRVMGLEDDDVE